MISESTIRVFLDIFGYPEICKKCGMKIWRMIDKRVQPHLYNADLTTHSRCEESKTLKVKKMIEAEMRNPGGDTW